MRALLLCFLATTVLAPLAGAQTLTLTEAEAIARLDPQGPQVRAVRASVDLARATELAAGRWPNPRFTFNRESVAGIAEMMFLVTQPLPLTGQRDLDVSVAAARTVATSYRADAYARRLQADLRLAFARVWLAQTHVEELTRVHDQV